MKKIKDTEYFSSLNLGHVWLGSYKAPMFLSYQFWFCIWYFHFSIPPSTESEGGKKKKVCRYSQTCQRLSSHSWQKHLFLPSLSNAEDVFLTAYHNYPCINTKHLQLKEGWQRILVLKLKQIRRPAWKRQPQLTRAEDLASHSPFQMNLVDQSLLSDIWT